ncbi:TPA: hypothetical protein N0F65_006217 [Lagenidium giganteum]|uniref:Uncharacterized protein n=1 Tax=Lagenidium giganteum TaxID=4803 RepID=A0AAV2Z0U8_9STRA|nr:TPA: hypothetical protein N0F65_006217 [Lagenidium giganteum]
MRASLTKTTRDILTRFSTRQTRRKSNHVTREDGCVLSLPFWTKTRHQAALLHETVDVFEASRPKIIMVYSNMSTLLHG